MERSTILYLKQKGWTNTQIAEFMQCDRGTVAKVLTQPVDLQPHSRDRHSSIEIYTDQIDAWLDQHLTVKRMLELARADATHPYTGGETAFYDYVRKRTRARKLKPSTLAIRFEGLPGELLQIDWGEVRQFPFTKPDLAGQTRYFFAARLKYSRFMAVQFAHDMREETLLRCLIASFRAIGGVPWVVTTDNMKTVVLGRDASFQPIWHPAYQKLAAEFRFLPDACTPAAGNQKGAVENLVKFVKGNLLAGRTFYDDDDLATETTLWLQRVNDDRPSSATERPPRELLRQEQPQFYPLPSSASDYGFFESLLVSREGLVHWETNRYSVPAHLVGHALTARIYETRLELYQDSTLVASHPRCGGRNQRVVTPAHFEAAFVGKPRARVMVYRDWLVGLSPVAAAYISIICRKQRDTMAEQMVGLYDLAQQLGRADFLAALELAAEQQSYGVEYVRAIATHPRAPERETPAEPLTVPVIPTQREIERDLAQYEIYVANRTILKECDDRPHAQVTVEAGDAE